MRFAHQPTLRGGEREDETEATAAADTGALRTVAPQTAATRTGATRTARPRRQRHGPAPGEGGSLVLGRYRLAHPLGAGGFATVWLALDERLEREVAVKVIPQQRVIRARFEREVWAAARLSHPGIVTLFEAAADRRAAYLVSELVHGSTLEHALAEGELSDRAIAVIAMSLCDALAYAHSEGIVHRDVKPSNILIPDAAPTVSLPAKLTDFGVAHAVGGDALTATGDVVGTAAYMAPEQAAGREPRPETDLYALALVTYEALTGVNPLTAARGQRATRLGVYLPPLRRQRRELPRELGHGIDLALRPRPGERGTLAELHGALEASLESLADDAGVVGEPWRPHPWRAVAERRSTALWSAEDAGDHDRHAHAVRRADQPGQHGAASARDTLERPPADDPVPRDRRPTRAQSGAEPAASLAARAGAAAIGALVTGWLAAHALAPSPLAPTALALAAAGLLLFLPRLGFVLVAGSLVLLALIQGHSGEALVLAAGTGATIALAPGGVPPWTLAGGAPALGMLGLAGAWPALAARAGTVRKRAVLGATGWLWLALGGALVGSPLYVGLSAPTPPFSVWSASPSAAAHHVLGALISSGAWAPAPVWAMAAVVLPVLVTRHSLFFDAARVACWTASLVACTEAALLLAHPGAGRASLHTVAIGALVAALIALTPSALGAWRVLRSGYSQARVS